MTATTTIPTDEQIAAAILAQLTEHRLQRWAVVLRRVPGSERRKDRVLTDLFERYRVNIVFVGGVPHVRLTDDYDRLAAAAVRDRMRQTFPWLGERAGRCRDLLIV